MSPASSDQPFLFQTLKGKLIAFDAQEKAIITSLLPLVGDEWDSYLKDESIDKYIVKIGSPVLRAERDKLVKDIKAKLLAIQGPYCIYCGMHFKHCGNLQREHIAPKGKKLYPAFVFEEHNLCLACNKCNCELKKDADVASGDKSNYKNNSFSIIHPYIDDIKDHLEFAVKDGKCLIKVKNKSDKGIATIKMFRLASLERTAERSGLLMVEEVKPSPENDKNLNEILNKKYLPK